MMKGGKTEKCNGLAVSGGLHPKENSGDGLCYFLEIVGKKLWWGGLPRILDQST